MELARRTQCLRWPLILPPTDPAARSWQIASKLASFSIPTSGVTTSADEELGTDYAFGMLTDEVPNEGVLSSSCAGLPTPYVLGKAGDDNLI